MHSSSIWPSLSPSVCCCVHQRACVLVVYLLCLKFFRDLPTDLLLCRCLSGFSVKVKCKSVSKSVSCLIQRHSAGLCLCVRLSNCLSVCLSICLSVYLYTSSCFPRCFVIHILLHYDFFFLIFVYSVLHQHLTSSHLLPLSSPSPSLAVLNHLSLPPSITLTHSIKL